MERLSFICQLYAMAFLALLHISLHRDKTNIRRVGLTNRKVFCFFGILCCSFLVFLLGLWCQFFLVPRFLLNDEFV